MKKLLLVVILISFNSLFAQYSWTKAEVTLTNGSVLKGEAALVMITKGINLAKEKLKFKANKKSKTKKYLPKEIKQVIFTVTYIEKIGGKKWRKPEKKNTFQFI